MTKPKWYHRLFAAASQDVESPSIRLYSPNQEAEAYAGNGNLDDMHREQLDFDSAVNINKGKVAAYGLAKIWNPLAAAFLALSAEDARNIYHRSTEPIDTPLPASWSNVAHTFNNRHSNWQNKLGSVTDAAITTDALISGFKPMFKHIVSGSTAREIGRRAWDATKALGVALGASTAIGVGVGASGMYEERPGLAEFIMQSAGNLPYIPQFYKGAITTLANKYRPYKPTVVDAYGNIVIRPKTVLEVNNKGKLKYKGEEYGPQIKKDIFSKLGAGAPWQDNSVVEVRRGNNVIWSYDPLSELPVR